MTLEERALAKEIATKLKDQFGSDTLTADQFAKYLGKCRAYVCQRISVHLLPGAKVGHSYVIPVDSVALWEARLAKTKDVEPYQY